MAGSSIGANVFHSGTAYVLSGGTTTQLTVTQNCFEIISSGGIASNTTAASAGYEVALSGGIVSGATLTSGGVLVLNSGAVVSGAVNFSGINNEIIVASGATPGAAVLSGFIEGDFVDLAGIGYTAGVTSFTYANSGMSGTLTVTSGAQAISLNLMGQYVAGNFTLANDGAGGTLLGDPPVSSGAIAAHSLKDATYA